MVVWYFIVWCGVGALVGYVIGNTKDRAMTGFWWGLLLGVIGWIVIALMSPGPEEEARRAAVVAAAFYDEKDLDKEQEEADTRPCPWCAESIKRAAVVCRYCGRDVEPVLGSHDAAAIVASRNPDDDVVYGTEGWSVVQRTEFAERLASAQIPHEWVGREVRVERQYEDAVDSLLAQ
jgi:hypothetical protein